MGDAVTDPTRPGRADQAARDADDAGYDPFDTVGQSGLLRFGGFVQEEFLPQLRDRKGRETMREMADNDPVVGAGLLTLDLMQRQVTWTVKPAGWDKAGHVQPADQEVADFCWSALNDMAISWPDTLSQHLSMVPFGWAWSEEVYKWRRGHNGREDGTESDYDDGLIGFAGIENRAQETLYNWRFADVGSKVTAMVQQAAPDYRLQPIPYGKSLHFRTTANKDNPEGFSLLRRAYRPWFFKRRIEELEAIGIERDLVGMPVMSVPLNHLSRNATEKEKQLVVRLRNTLRQIRRNEADGMIVPLEYDADGNQLYNFELLRGGGPRQFDLDDTIGRWDQRIAMALLVDFMLLGHEGSGGGGGLGVTLGAVKIDLLTAMLASLLEQIAVEYSQRAFTHLLTINGFDLASRPTLEPGEVKQANLPELGQYVLNLANAGAPIFPNKVVEKHLLDQADIPYEDAGGQL